jgi:hypothetical protein
VSATNVPDTPSQAKRNSMRRVPRGLLEETADYIDSATCSKTKPCKSGSVCWYVAIIVITCRYSFSSTYLDRQSIADVVSLATVIAVLDSAGTSLSLSLYLIIVPSLTNLDVL